ncbi:MAG TPA: primosomal replication protein N [Rhodocyclaceae bacterium]
MAKRSRPKKLLRQLLLPRRRLPRPDQPRRANKLNQYCVSGALIERAATRYTPAGIPVCEAKLAHDEAATEAGGERQVTFELAVLGLGEAAKWLEAAALGTRVRLEGFLAPKSQNSRQLVLHLNRIEFL